MPLVLLLSVWVPSFHDAHSINYLLKCLCGYAYSVLVFKMSSVGCHQNRDADVMTCKASQVKARREEAARKKIEARISMIEFVPIGNAYTAAT